MTTVEWQRLNFGQQVSRLITNLLLYHLQYVGDSIVTASQIPFSCTLAVESKNLTFLAAHPVGEPDVLPVPVPYTTVPAALSWSPGNQTLREDPWRSLAGFSRKVTAGERIECGVSKPSG